ncbi:MAG: tetraacyldisaccharide 4'-kinase [Bacteroidota bacterium]
MKLRRLLFPFAIIYDLVTRIRNFCFDKGILKSTEFDIPVISIGNLSMGGTGKTPHVEYLLTLLSPHFEIATLSRGYGRSTKGYLEVNKTSSADQSGDEPLQYKLKFPEVKVAVCENRVEGINQILKSGKAEVVILDDAYQHRHVKPSLNILLTVYGNLFTDDYIIPAGNLREAASGSNRADIIIITKCPVDLADAEKNALQGKVRLHKHQQLFFSTFTYQPIVALNNAEEVLPANYKNYHVLMLTGIADPEPMKIWLQKEFKSVTTLIFPDHHQFDEKDLNRIGEKFNNIASPAIIVTTEKDFTRLSNRALSFPLYILPVKVNFGFNSNEQFDQYILNHVRKNKTNG